MIEDLRDKIVDTARRMFVAEGIKAVRMDDIAHTAGVSKRTIYELFENKEDLIYFTMKRHLENTEKLSRKATLKAPNVIVEMLLITRHIIEQSLENWQMLNTLRKFYPHIHQRLHGERSEEQRAAFKSKLERGINDGLFEERTNLDLAMAMLYYTITNIVVPREDREHPYNITPQEALFELTIYFLRGIATPKGIKIVDDFIKEK